MSDIELKLKKSLMKTMLDNGEPIVKIAKSVGLSQRQTKNLLPEVGYFSLPQAAEKLGMFKGKYGDSDRLKGFYTNNIAEIGANCSMEGGYISKKCFERLSKVYDRRRYKSYEGHTSLTEAAKRLGMVISGFPNRGTYSRITRFYKNNEKEIRSINRSCPSFEDLVDTGIISDECLETVKKVYEKKRKKRNPIKTSSIALPAAAAILIYIAYRLTRR